MCRKKIIEVEVEEFLNISELNDQDVDLIQNAKNAIALSYSPYSKFRVGAAALLDNGKVLLGSNQENASYSLCMCAERVLLGYISSLYPQSKIISMAITASNKENPVKVPISPCGACRQVLSEKEDMQNQSFSLILHGETGKVYKLNSCKSLLPLSFDNSYL
ncbi:MAG: cytidine deaminase [Saprospiraceae bacterium]|nr:cytidine deaminase [Saprospiraceae bacterium]